MEGDSLVEVGSSEWLRLKSNGVSGTDASIIVGTNPYDTPVDLWKRKLGLGQKHFNFTANERMKWGTLFEAIVAKEYAKSNDMWLVPGKFMVNEWKCGTPDFTVFDKEIGLEIKTTSYKNLTRLQSGDWMPYWETQCRWYMMLTGYPEWHLAALVGGQHLLSTVFHRDIIKEKNMVDQCHDFWFDNVLKKTPPRSK